jgi:monofunctional chorismate mutase
MSRNDLTTDDVISVLFTSTPDLTAEFPALAARKIGFHDVPLICAQELDIEGAMPRVVRVLAQPVHRVASSREQRGAAHPALAEAPCRMPIRTVFTRRSRAFARSFPLNDQGPKHAARRPAAYL